jgi:hypothetical protein
MTALGMTEADLLHSPFELVLADWSILLLSTGSTKFPSVMAAGVLV